QLQSDCCDHAKSKHDDDLESCTSSTSNDSRAARSMSSSSSSSGTSADAHLGLDLVSSSFSSSSSSSCSSTYRRRNQQQQQQQSASTQSTGSGERGATGMARIAVPVKRAAQVTRSTTSNSHFRASSSSTLQRRLAARSQSSQSSSLAATTTKGTSPVSKTSLNCTRHFPTSLPKRSKSNLDDNRTENMESKTKDETSNAALHASMSMTSLNIVSSSSTTARGSQIPVLSRLRSHSALNRSTSWASISCLAATSNVANDADSSSSQCCDESRNVVNSETEQRLIASLHQSKKNILHQRNVARTIAAPAACEQCAQLRSELSEAQQQVCQLREQVTEFEEAENDLRSLSQRLQRQVEALEAQLVSASLVPPIGSVLSRRSSSLSLLSSSNSSSSSSNNNNNNNNNNSTKQTADVSAQTDESEISLLNGAQQQAASNRADKIETTQSALVMPAIASEQPTLHVVTTSQPRTRAKIARATISKVGVTTIVVNQSDIQNDSTTSVSDQTGNKVSARLAAVVLDYPISVVAPSIDDKSTINQSVVNNDACQQVEQTEVQREHKERMVDLQRQLLEYQSLNDALVQELHVSRTHLSKLNAVVDELMATDCVTDQVVRQSLAHLCAVQSQSHTIVHHSVANGGSNNGQNHHMSLANMRRAPCIEFLRMLLGALRSHHAKCMSGQLEVQRALASIMERLKESQQNNGQQQRSSEFALNRCINTWACPVRPPPRARHPSRSSSRMSTGEAAASSSCTRILERNDSNASLPGPTCVTLQSTPVANNSCDVRVIQGNETTSRIFIGDTSSSSSSSGGTHHQSMQRHSWPIDAQQQVNRTQIQVSDAGSEHDQLCLHVAQFKAHVHARLVELASGQNWIETLVSERLSIMINTTALCAPIISRGNFQSHTMNITTRDDNTNRSKAFKIKTSINNNHNNSDHQSNTLTAYQIERVLALKDNLRRKLCSIFRDIDAQRSGVRKACAISNLSSPTLVKAHLQQNNSTHAAAVRDLSSANDAVTPEMLRDINRGIDSSTSSNRWSSNQAQSSSSGHYEYQPNQDTCVYSDTV
ncbi:hypothetical protein GZH46_01302, partial [Fragariocoptes setiger]